MYEIAVSGKKLIGSAQKRGTGYFLQHGSLILEPSPHESHLYREAPLHLSDLLSPLPDRSEIEKNMRQGFENTWHVRVEEDTLTPEETQQVQQLVLEKYDNSTWNTDRNK